MYVGSKNEVTVKLATQNRDQVDYNVNGLMHSHYSLISFQFILQNAVQHAQLTTFHCPIYMLWY